MDYCIEIALIWIAVVAALVGVYLWARPVARKYVWYGIGAGVGIGALYIAVVG